MKVSVGSSVPDLVGFAPVLGGVALLGEAKKIAAVSVYRFASVSAKQGGGLTVAMRGKPGEVVTLLYSAGGGGPIKQQNATIGANGTAAATLRS